MVSNPDWAPSVFAPTPVLSTELTYAVDRARHPLRLVTQIRRDPILKDLINKLAARAA